MRTNRSFFFPLVMFGCMIIVAAALIFLAPAARPLCGIGMFPFIVPLMFAALCLFGFWRFAGRRCGDHTHRTSGE